MDEGRVLRYTADLDRELSKTMLRDLFVTENKNAHTFRIRLLRGGQAVDLTGAAVSGMFSRYKTRDTVPVSSGRVENGEVVLTLPSACYAVRTMFCLIIDVVIGDVTLSVFAGEGSMLSNRFDRIDNTDGDIPSLNELLAQVAAMKDATARANEAADRVEQLEIDASGLAQNALQLGGTPAAEYALKTDTVANALQLGGKEPEYYLPAVNLLDNPDFAIAQAGYGGMHGSAKYAADRWPVNSGSIIPAKTNNGFSLTSGGTSANIIWQFLCGAAEDYLARPFTLGVYTQDGNAYAVHFVFPSVISANFSSDVISIGNWKFDVVFFTTRDMPSVRVYTTAANDTIELKGIALLPGTYTADTLPPFVPPDPVLELAKCGQYYRQSFEGNDPTDTYGIVTIPAISAGNLQRIVFDTPMRETDDVPTVTVYNYITGAEGVITDWLTDTEVTGTTCHLSFTDYRGFMVRKNDNSLTAGKIYAFNYSISLDL